MKRLWIMIAAVILGGGVTAAVSTPAWAAGTNYFTVDWTGGPHPVGSTTFLCTHGMSYPANIAQVIGYKNNCAVRVWAYDRSGNGQCISPGKNATAQSSVIGRVYISTNTAAC